MNVLDQIRAAREREWLFRTGTFALWRDCCMDQARDWVEWQQSAGVDLSADVARNVAEARRWNHELVKLLRKRKLQ